MICSTPAVTEGRMATAQFWLHNVGVPVMLAALALRLMATLAWQADQPASE